MIGLLRAISGFVVGTEDIGSTGGPQTTKLPRHVAIIMDGNGRWAKRRFMPRHAGHRAGVKSVRMAVEQCARLKIEVLTLFAFSSENWSRPKEEVSQLMELFMSALRSEVKRLKKNRVRLRIIGDRSAFSARLQERMAEAEAMTADGDGLLLQIAANYGGRWDITEAARTLARQVRQGELDPEEIDEARLGAALSFSDCPDPDLFIRTGGDQRISNFLLWHLAYCELYFSPLLWPEFNEAEFQRALDSFSGRERRFGKTGEQVAADSGSR